MLKSRIFVNRLTPFVKQSTRNTVIVKRVYKPPLVTTTTRSPLETPQHIIDKSVVHTDDDKYMVYRIEEFEQDDHLVKVILLRDVDDYGVKGQIVNFPSIDVNRDLILPGLAVYHNEENLERYSNIIIPEETKMNSSESARVLANLWTKRVLDVCMHMDNPWTIEPWHIKASLRKHRTWISSDKISIPGGTITGPDLSLENKEFISIITINGFEKVKVRCRIHHLSTDPDRAIRLESWYSRLAEPVFEHERQELLDMNRQKPSWRILHNPNLEAEMERFKEWKNEREMRLSESSQQSQ